MGTKEIQTEIPGTERHPKNKKIEALASTLDTLRLKKSKLATKIGDTERGVIKEMEEAGLQKYYMGDEVVELDPGKKHVKIKTVQAKGSTNGEAATEEEDDDDDE